MQIVNTRKILNKSPANCLNQHLTGLLFYADLRKLQQKKAQTQTANRFALLNETDLQAMETYAKKHRNTYKILLYNEETNTTTRIHRNFHPTFFRFSQDIVVFL